MPIAIPSILKKVTHHPKLDKNAPQPQNASNTMLLRPRSDLRSRKEQIIVCGADPIKLLLYVRVKHAA